MVDRTARYVAKDGQPFEQVAYRLQIVEKCIIDFNHLDLSVCAIESSFVPI